MKKAGDTGWIAILDTGSQDHVLRSGQILMRFWYRREPNNLAGPRVVVSDDPHTSHACGHDAHTAMLLGAMRVLAEQRDNLTGVIYFCFEEGEEDGRGILAMLNQLSAHGGRLLGIHVYAGLESGKICVSAGPRMAGAAGVGIKVIGRGDMAPDRICR